MDLTTFRSRVNKQRASYRLARDNAKTLNETLERTRTEVEDAATAQELAQQVAQAIQQQAHDQIAEVVSRCLSAVFDEPYVFRIHFERKRGRTEARLVFEREGMEVDPMTASGGGVVDVAAFALRLSCLILNKPPLRRVLILDEPFRFVSEQGEYQSRVRELLETLAREMGVQFIMVTHINELKAGKVVELG